MRMPSLFRLSILAILMWHMLPLNFAYAEARLTEDQARDVLVSQIQKDKLYDSWTTLIGIYMVPWKPS
jgi:hypothetical protein